MKFPLWSPDHKLLYENDRLSLGRILCTKDTFEVFDQNYLNVFGQ